MDVEPDETLDTRGQSCPMPVLETREMVDRLGEGEVLEVLATDPGAENDLRSFARRTVLEFLGIEEEGDFFRIYLKR
ncbi:MAG: putative sulfur carrier protein [Methanonatronarchaeales archaeon]|nr:putative sulfur carrier protein [Methanonatronarchaeales archaeon]